ncbi:hypothetical protein LCI18_015140 [Fusarium solani-melongenae]|uniref:Uncharacterized protein n=1 Tax=Fusarium solani subsp. cucurbitae TaxID=2747967 RepID=A0ACD3ZSJ7_FUSSC|nr:hypothetical protein LCI18_015140 [Fusarium solani-melongenae]
MHLLPILGLIFATVAAIVFENGGPYEVKLPEHLVNHAADSNHELERHICVAYEALFQLEPKYHASPPNLYKLLDVPPLPPTRASKADDGSANSARLRMIMVKLDGKMHKFFLERRALPKGPARDKVVKAISTWNKIGLVLLDPLVHKVYDREFGKKNVGKVLMKMCGERWKEEKRDATVI